ncbi:MAG: T9SS type A sorting domain-containing protein [Flavobacteriales bacterium]|nr:T9SS type A sorting domain-containing protein [Flavobacteriales bacterium]
MFSGAQAHRFAAFRAVRCIGGGYYGRPDLVELKQGIYFVRIQTDKGVFTQKLIIS